MAATMLRAPRGSDLYLPSLRFALRFVIISFTLEGCLHRHAPETRRERGGDTAGESF